MWTIFKFGRVGFRGSEGPKKRVALHLAFVQVLWQRVSAYYDRGGEKEGHFLVRNLEHQPAESPEANTAYKIEFEWSGNGKSINTTRLHFKPPCLTRQVSSPQTAQLFCLCSILLHSSPSCEAMYYPFVLHLRHLRGSAVSGVKTHVCSPVVIKLQFKKLTSQGNGIEAKTLGQCYSSNCPSPIFFENSGGRIAIYQNLATIAQMQICSQVQCPLSRPLRFSYKAESLSCDQMWDMCCAVCGPRRCSLSTYMQCQYLLTRPDSS